MIKRRLFTPGPVSAFPPALSAALDGNVHHRTPEFKEILADVVAGLRRIVGEPDQLYLFASSGTGAMEASVANLFSAGDQVLVASCGKFGERWIDLSKAYGLKPTVLQYPYGEPVRPEDIRAALSENSALRAVLMQACESSTGVQNDVETIAEMVRQSESLMIVDAITGVGTMNISARQGIDVIVCGSQKALMIPPGLAFLAMSERAWQRVAGSTLPKYYFDLRAARKSWDKDGQTAYTPATSLVVSLQASLREILRDGIDRLVENTANKARATRAAIQAMGLQVFAQRPANAMTAVKAPEGLPADKITGTLKQKFGIQVAGGQGELKGKIFRISHMGYVDHLDTLSLLAALEHTLRTLGVQVELGRALVEFQKVYAEVL